MNEQKFHHLEEALPEAPPAIATAVVRNAYTRKVAKQQEVACLMLAGEEHLKTVTRHFCLQAGRESQICYTTWLKIKALLGPDVEDLAIPYAYSSWERSREGDHGEPPNYRATLSNLESKKWLEAMNVEMQSMKDNQVWNLVDLPPNCKTIGSKWLIKKKTDMDGNIHIYKACLVAKGFTQTYGVDYEETFSPVADIKAIRILIAIAAYYDYEIWQMDVKTAFLNGRLNRDIYMVQPEGFVNLKHPRRVCKLQRSIYGLKQAFRS
ncbi:retrotransposon protein, putative, ty1-copia subclass [Tanacetum coccineum]